MKRIVTAAGVVCVAFLYTFSVQANETIEISGMNIPVIDGARQNKDLGRALVKGHVASFTVDRPLEEVIGFYTSFLEGNSFLIIGGRQPDDSFSAAIKKNDAQFSLRIYQNGGHTQIQFIW